MCLPEEERKISSCAGLSRFPVRSDEAARDCKGLSTVRIFPASLDLSFHNRVSCNRHNSCAALSSDYPFRTHRPALHQAAVKSSRCTRGWGCAPPGSEGKSHGNSNRNG